MADATKGPKAGFTRPVYVILHVNDESGNPMSLDRSQIEIHAVTRDAGVALAAMDSGDAGVTYKKVDKVT